MRCIINDEIIQAIHKNKFEEDIWFDNGWIATICHNRYSDLEYFIYFDKDNQNYSFVESLINAINQTDMNKVMQNIIRHSDSEKFSLDAAVTIRSVLQSDISDLQKSLCEIKQWMDGEAETRKISYNLSLKLTVNNKEVTLKDLTKSEKEKVKEQCQEWIYKLFEFDSYSEITAHEGFFISNVDKSVDNKID